MSDITDKPSFDVTHELRGLQAQYAELQGAIAKLNERFSGMGKAVMDGNARLEQVVSDAVQPVRIRQVAPTQSASIGQISAALSKAQREIGGIRGSGTANRGSFTTLEDMEEACAPVLEKYELAISPKLITNEFGEYVQVMTLSHSSDEWFESRALLNEEAAGSSLPLHQKIGYSEKYLKRYMYRTMLCLADNSKD